MTDEEILELFLPCPRIMHPETKQQMLACIAEARKEGREEGIKEGIIKQTDGNTDDASVAALRSGSSNSMQLGNRDIYKFLIYLLHRLPVRFTYAPQLLTDFIEDYFNDDKPDPELGNAITLGQNFTGLEFNKATIEPAIMQSAFEFPNGTKMICYTSYEQGIKSFFCEDNWRPQYTPFAACPFEWSGAKTMTEYHKKIRGLHKPECLNIQHSTVIIDNEQKVKVSYTTESPSNSKAD